MLKVVLAYNVIPARRTVLNLICMQLKAKLRVVQPEEFEEPVGYLAGVPGIASKAVMDKMAAAIAAAKEARAAEADEGAAAESGEAGATGAAQTVAAPSAPSAPAEAAPEADADDVDAPVPADALTREFVFLCGFDRPTLDRFLGSVQRSPLKKIDQKAMLTPTNVTWSGATLLREIAREHEYMKRNRGSMHGT